MSSALGRPAGQLAAAVSADDRHLYVYRGSELVARIDPDGRSGDERLARALLGVVLGGRPHPWLTARFRNDVVAYLDPAGWEMPVDWLLWWLDREGILHYQGDSMPEVSGMNRSFKAGAVPAVAA